ncbi:hypothetical protein J4N45_10210 [Vibrio sp. SCSIO 43140]|uniref:hypothetical protein n=1 Tax=Vibrio sp. SCSIO 43140 TaxID=2819100 RepID=UPI0020754E1D|nr:hypothetical protein [Vibrio sp. SCSIO 43140]USD58902.1 hypothetical protein J4N45_10210 [Vibrio sp. SCSIO 43140]
MNKIEQLLTEQLMGPWPQAVVNAIAWYVATFLANAIAHARTLEEALTSPSYYIATALTTACLIIWAYKAKTADKRKWESFK